jgi:hypothetical protein
MAISIIGILQQPSTILLLRGTDRHRTAELIPEWNTSSSLDMPRKLHREVKGLLELLTGTSNARRHVKIKCTRLMYQSLEHLTA